MTSQAPAKTLHALALLAVLRSAEADSDLKAAVRGLTGIRLDSRIGRLEDLGTKVVELRSPGVLLLDVKLDDAAEMALLERVIQKHASVMPVIVTSADASIDGVRRLMRMGISEFLPQPITAADLLSALEAAASRPNVAPRVSRRTSGIFSVIKPRGGMGATTLAVQMAHALARGGKTKKEVCLLDLDVQYGNAALYLDMHPRFSLENLLEEPERLDASFLRGITSHHKSGIELLAAPPQPLSLEDLTPDLVTNLLDVAAAEYDYIVVDLPQAWVRWTKTVLGRSDIIMQVVQMTVPALRQGRQQLEALGEEGLGRIPTIVVANRHDRSIFGKSEISKAEAESALGRSIGFSIDNDFKTVSQALNHGVPIGEVRSRSPIEKQVRHLVESSVKMLAGEGLPKGAADKT